MDAAERSCAATSTSTSSRSRSSRSCSSCAVGSGVTKAGRSFLAVRDIEDRAVAFGVEPGPSKLLAYALSGAIVGLAGSLFALKAGSISAKDPFLLLESLLLVAIVVVGGAGSAAGIVTAAVLIKGLPQFSSTIPFTHLQADRIVPIGSAALLVVVVVVAPEGIGGLYRADRAALDRWLDRAHARAPTRARTLPTRRAGRDATLARRAASALAAHARARAARSATTCESRYGGVTALDGVSLEVRRGEIVGPDRRQRRGEVDVLQRRVGSRAGRPGRSDYRGVELVGRRASGRSALGAARTFQDVGLLRPESVVENVLLAQTWLARYAAAVGIVGLGGSRAHRGASCAGAAGSRSSSSASTIWPTSGSATSPTARCAWSRSRRRSPPVPTCCCSTRPPPASGPKSRTNSATASSRFATSST